MDDGVDNGTVKSPELLDKAAVALSGLCLLHCLALPFAVVLLPFLNELAVDRWHAPMLLVVIPVSVLAFTAGFRRHANHGVIATGVTGMALLVVGGTFAHYLLGLAAVASQAARHELAVELAGAGAPPPPSGAGSPLDGVSPRAPTGAPVRAAPRHGRAQLPKVKRYLGTPAHPPTRPEPFRMFQAAFVAEGDEDPHQRLLASVENFRWRSKPLAQFDQQQAAEIRVKILLGLLVAVSERRRRLGHCILPVLSFHRM